MVSQLTRLKAWLFEGIKGKETVHKDPWWSVMCLTGVDYFSSMGFQPGLAFLAAGILSPLATLNLVIVTLIGALPAYWVVAEESPHGRGSLAIFERLVRGWVGKTIVLVILGFAATDFIFTITMCASDATSHIIENPAWPQQFRDRVLITLVLIAALGGLFLKGFKEAIQLCLLLVIAYLCVNTVTLTVCTVYLLEHRNLIDAWLQRINHDFPNPWQMMAISALAFPQLALGLSGFETGVAVMPHIKTDGDTPQQDLTDRIKKTRLLLVTVAVIMGAFLLVGCLVTTVLIEPQLFQEGQAANGRALAYLTHKFLGQSFGTVYDIITVLILWFAGASAMAALLSLVPQYLPRYGMAPAWAAAKRPLIIFVTLLSFAITIAFRADVDSQAGAFATGLLVLITSGTIAVTMVVWHRSKLQRFAFIAISLLFVYADINVMLTRPDGLAISLMFIVSILVSSLASRALRSTELRIEEIIFDDKATLFVKRACKRRWGEVRILAHKKDNDDDIDYEQKEKEARLAHSIQTREGDFIFLEVTPEHVSDFIEEKLYITGHEVGGYEILRCSSPSVPNAIAALLLNIRDMTGKVPHVYFGWTEGHPIAYVFKYILFGEGETAPLTREILRSKEQDPDKRPKVHVG
ncbi:MAG: hypothetical protein K2X93_14225 [Candidatus Obscuribacterales bacterium]|nr:hypothetical protein [Candidatus Obscuribacterales bacterium]